MSRYILGLKEIHKNHISLAGGKGANLGALWQIPGIRVPGGFCITTEAYKELINSNKEIGRLIDALAEIKAGETEKISLLCAAIRSAIENTGMPGALVSEIRTHLAGYAENEAFAIRSSATAEDLPGASFAGQQDTYLNIIGTAAILLHISKCWASLFTERAVTYRIQNGFGHQPVQLAVVMQQMVFPDVSGIMFTADPVTQNRKVVSIDAGFGLGEALVSGLVSADNYKVREGQIIHKNIQDKKLAVYALQEGGTARAALPEEQRKAQALSDIQILKLAETGRAIEAHFGCPQDIEWCLAGGIFYVVQARPVPALFPIPETHDNEKHVFISVGHQQMMTDALKPLGLSIRQLSSARPMFTAAGRQFVDVAANLATAQGRAMLLNMIGKGEPLIGDAINILIDREFIPLADAAPNAAPPMGAGHTPIDNDPAIVQELIARNELSVSILKERIKTVRGPALFDLILEDIKLMKQELFDAQTISVVMAAANAPAWVNAKVQEWLGEKNVADILAYSAPGNVTAEMGLALLNAADVIRQYPEVINYLEHTEDEGFLGAMDSLAGGPESRAAIMSFLDKYGMRCAGEIDITKDRWSENPAVLIPVILSHIKSFAPGEAARRFNKGSHEATQKEQQLLAAIRQLPGGEEKAAETRQMINAIRTFSGYREYPKYVIVTRFFEYKKALLQEAEKLAHAGIINDKEDIYYLSFEELREAVLRQRVDNRLIARRKEEYLHDSRLTPPRVMTSEGEIITGRYRHEAMPRGALAGLAVSTGVAEGRARVILNMEDADLQEGDILVTPFTDPSWTPLFVLVKGLVTEVGGLMTHGAVIAREYGLPAVVSVENATALIKDGQRIRLNGTEGWVEIL